MAESDARRWLRNNGYADVADTIDAVIDDWRQQGRKTRRNWWDVLAGTENGSARTIGDHVFPILEIARERKGWPPVEDMLLRKGTEIAPPIRELARWHKNPPESV